MKSRSGFTIVELLIVIVVIAVLASITVVAYNGIQARSKDSRRDAAVRVYKNALEMYKADNGQYPFACSNNPNLDCAATDLAAYLVPTYVQSLPNIENNPKYGLWGMYYAQADRYTLVVPYDSKTPCKTGVNPRADYKAEYPLCT